jgi:hypothetical protein
MPFIILSDDELIARLLIHTWTLTTGKTLRGDVPPHELTEEELIDFWSDDHFTQPLPAEGRRESAPALPPGEARWNLQRPAYPTTERSSR